MRGLAIAAIGLMLIGITACTDDESGASGSDDTMAEAEARELLGPEDAASGEPVPVGMVSDGQTAAYDNSMQIRAAEATVEYLNTHRAGIGGRPIELVTCETGGTPDGATDCGNQFVEEEVVAVAAPESAVLDSVWQPVHDAGIPMMDIAASAQSMILDDESTFNMVNPLSTLLGLPVSVAEDIDADKMAFVTVDIPIATEAIDMLAPSVLDERGIDHELFAIPLGTPDMSSQMQQVVDSEPDIVQVIGDDAFCIAAFQGLATAEYEGEITTVSQCLTDATREAIPAEQLEGIHVTALVSHGDENDRDNQLFEAVMSTYGEPDDIDNALAMVSFSIVASLGAALEGIEGDITPQTVTQAIASMEETEVPGMGGATFRCDGSAMELMPSVCTNQWLETTLDAEGQPDGYEVVDSTELLSSVALPG